MKKLILAAAVATTLSLSSCRIVDIATPEEQAQIEAMEIALDEAETAIAAAVHGVEAATKDLSRAARKGDVQGIVAAQAALEAQAREIELLEASWRAQASDLAELDRAIISREVSPWLTAVGSFLPAPAQPFLPLLLPLLGLAFDRPRKHVAKSLRSALRGSLAEAGLSLGRALGYAHTSPETARVAAEQDLDEKAKKLGA